MGQVLVPFGTYSLLATSSATMRAPIANRWTPFGLERDPFFQNELSATDEALYPASAYFVGRASELERVATTVGSGVSSCTVVEGDAGVGKTSFVNGSRPVSPPVGHSLTNNRFARSTIPPFTAWSRRS